LGLEERHAGSDSGGMLGYTATDPERHPHPHSSEDRDVRVRLAELCTLWSIAQTPFYYVTTRAELTEVVSFLAMHSAIGIDLEHSSLSYHGTVSLIQISVPGYDFVLDAYALYPHMHLLRGVFSDPTIIKVLHGSDNDILWLMRDFRLYIVNLFDTGRAARVLRKGAGLGSLLRECFGIQMDKEQQTSDWSLRPLLPVQLFYARCDTHWLLPLFHRLTALLAERGGYAEEQAWLHSRQVSLKVFRPTPPDNTRHLPLLADTYEGDMDRHRRGRGSHVHTPRMGVRGQASVSPVAQALLLHLTAYVDTLGVYLNLSPDTVCGGRDLARLALSLSVIPPSAISRESVLFGLSLSAPPLIAANAAEIALLAQRVLQYRAPPPHTQPHTQPHHGHGQVYPPGERVRERDSGRESAMRDRAPSYGNTRPPSQPSGGWGAREVMAPPGGPPPPPQPQSQYQYQYPATNPGVHCLDDLYHAVGWDMPQDNRGGWDGRGRDRERERAREEWQWEREDAAESDGETDGVTALSSGVDIFARALDQKLIKQSSRDKHGPPQSGRGKEIFRQFGDASLHGAAPGYRIGDIGPGSKVSAVTGNSLSVSVEFASSVEGMSVLDVLHQTGIDQVLGRKEREDIAHIGAGRDKEGPSRRERERNRREARGSKGRERDGDGSRDSRSRSSGHRNSHPRDRSGESNPGRRRGYDDPRL
ncbi:hypothetical protein KIPB_004362, partial [Kipferlia bialata]